MKKKFEEQVARDMPKIIGPDLNDPAFQAVVRQFSPEALKATSPPVPITETAAVATTPEAPAAAATPENAVETGQEYVPELPTAPKVEKPAPLGAQIPKPAAKPTAAPATTEDLQKKTFYPSEAGRKFLKRFRRTHNLAQTLVAEYALEQLFEAETDQAIVAPLHALGHGLRRSRNDPPRRPLTVYLDTKAVVRLDTLYDDFEIAAGIVGGHAIDWLSMTRSEAAIVAALRERGYGYYRSSRGPDEA